MGIKGGYGRRGRPSKSWRSSKLFRDRQNTENLKHRLQYAATKTATSTAIAMPVTEEMSTCINATMQEKIDALIISQAETLAATSTAIAMQVREEMNKRINAMQEENDALMSR